MPRERIRCQKEPDLKNKTEDANNKQIYERSSAIMSEYFQRKVVSFRLQEVLEMSWNEQGLYLTPCICWCLNVTDVSLTASFPS